MTATLLLLTHLIAVIVYGTAGNETGVGKNVLVAAEQDDDLQLCTTDENSRCDFYLEYGYVTVNAYPPRSSPLYRWECAQATYLDEPSEGVVVYCVRRLDVFIPLVRDVH